MRQMEEKLALGPAWNDTGPVFTSTIGTPIEPRNLARHFHSLLDDLRLPRQRIYDLRHTCASLLLVQGIHPRVLMEVLGHSQISLTMDTYAYVMLPAHKESDDMTVAGFGGD